MMEHATCDINKKTTGFKNLQEVQKQVPHFAHFVLNARRRLLTEEV